MTDQAVNDDAVFRAKLGGRLVMGASAGVILLGIIVVSAAAWTQYHQPGSTALKDTAQLIFTAILPLLGTWVGTVLAYYYTRENFEAASRNTLEAVRSSSERLASTRVSEKMMPAINVITAKIPAGQKIDDLPLKGIGDCFAKAGANGQKITRLLITNDSGACIGIVHRSLWVEMLNLGLQQTPKVDPQADSFAKLLALPYPSALGPTFKEFVENTLAYLALDRSVADAKAAMEAKPQCQDVIVTQSGKSDEPMRGWISNVDIMRLSQA
jgi:hypothetical protein